MGNWYLGETQRDYARRGLPPPDEVAIRERCLREKIEAPDLATVKDFLRFYVATSRGKIVKRPTADSVNMFAEWFFAGFTRVTGILTDAEERSEVYKINCTVFRSRYKATGLTLLSGYKRP